MESLEVKDTDNKIFVMLGGRRNGTSFMAKALGEHGVKIDTCGNGHNEDIDFVNFNEKILKEAGGDWNHLPPDAIIAEMVEKHRDELVNLLKSKQNKMWGWKDPRQGALIKHYLPYLEGDVYLVSIFRRPERVADSFGRIWGTGRKEAMKVNKEYNQRTIEAIKEFCDV